MNRIAIAFTLLIIFSVSFFSCNSKSNREMTNESAVELIDSIYAEYLNKINGLHDSMLVAKSNDDIDLFLKYLYDTDVAFVEMLNDFGAAAYVPAYSPLEKDSVWYWIKENHYKEADIYIRHRKDVFGIEENPLMDK